MLSEQKATTHKIVAKVVQRPEFSGSLHDDVMARSLGYPAALVPGIDVYAYLTRLILKSWGDEWFSKGILSSSSLRPVYDGDELVISADKVRHNEGARSVKLTVHNTSGVMVASASASISDNRLQSPSLEDFPIMNRPSLPQPGDPQSMSVGMRFSCISETVSEQDNARLVSEFLDLSPIYLSEAIIHPAYLQRFALKHAHASFAHATPPIYISAEGQNFSPARVGDLLEVSGAITRLWERKGHYYMDSEQLVIANRQRAIMLIRRTTIYQARQNASAEEQPSAANSKEPAGTS